MAVLDICDHVVPSDSLPLRENLAWWAATQRTLKNHKTVKIGGWALARDNTVCHELWSIKYDYYNFCSVNSHVSNLTGCPMQMPITKQRCTVYTGTINWVADCQIMLYVMNITVKRHRYWKCIKIIHKIYGTSIPSSLSLLHGQISNWLIYIKLTLRRN